MRPAKEDSRVRMVDWVIRGGGFGVLVRNSGYVMMGVVEVGCSRSWISVVGSEEVDCCCDSEVEEAWRVC